MIMALRDHTLSKAPYLLADEGKREAMLEGNEAWPARSSARSSATPVTTGSTCPRTAAG